MIGMVEEMMELRMNETKNPFGNEENDDKA